ncbi:MAG TPA: CHRD domain-containing protein [Blastocatellia bacterium]|nr:CHRD domain-containing protein [Blastocatellia bacterium]
MKRVRFTAFVAAIAVLAMLGIGAPGGAAGDSKKNSLKADLVGVEEVPANSTTGSGELRIRIANDDSSFDFELTYEELEGETTLFAHIHLGQKGVIGGISVFLCGGGGRPACTPTSGTFSGTVTAADVIGPTGQGIAAGEFAELLRALRDGATYVNVHTNKHPPGEIRGQIK